MKIAANISKRLCSRAPNSRQFERHNARDRRRSSESVLLLVERRGESLLLRRPRTRDDRLSIVLFASTRILLAMRLLTVEANARALARQHRPLNAYCWRNWSRSPLPPLLPRASDGASTRTNGRKTMTRRQRRPRLRLKTASETRQPFSDFPFALSHFIGSVVSTKKDDASKKKMRAHIVRRWARGSEK